MEISSLAALSLGLINIGNMNEEVTSAIIQTMMERDESKLKDGYAKFMGLGLALLYLSKQELAEATIETLKIIESPLAKMSGVMVEVCAFAGTIQFLPHLKLSLYLSPLFRFSLFSLGSSKLTRNPYNLLFFHKLLQELEMC